MEYSQASETKKTLKMGIAASLIFKSSSKAVNQ